MKNWLMLSGLWVVTLCFNVGICFADQQICVNLPDDLYKALVTTVDNENNAGVASNPGYVLQTVPGYLERHVQVWAKSYKEDIEKKIIETPELRQMAIQLSELPSETQAYLKQLLATAVGENK